MPMRGWPARGALGIVGREMSGRRSGGLLMERSIGKVGGIEKVGH